MKRLQAKNLFLSFIMLLVLGYQSVHSLEHSLERMEKSYTHDHHQKGGDGTSFSAKSDCLVCEFQFLTNDFDFQPNLIPHKLEIPFSKKSDADYEVFYTSDVRGVASLRAPPVFVFA